MKSLGISLSGALLPGLGHMLLGLRRRGAVLFVVLTAMFMFGVTLHPDAERGGGFFAKYKKNILHTYQDYQAPFQQTDRGRDLEGPIDTVWRLVFIYLYPFFVGIVNYLVGFFWQSSQYVDALLPYRRGEIPVAVKDIGDCFALLSGLLNLLVMLDAHDLAVNRETLAKMQRGGQAA
ncbi:MAG: hypothetical protein HYY25_04085 [Candidatus Wallbacteria bacterium]|nr:hypothetical protein [Candidatus Wallbacteria bacterium]